MNRAESPEGQIAPLVSVIVPNFNGRDILEQCLNSLMNAHYHRNQLEIIVVDNGSTDGSQEMLGRKHGVKLVALGENEGFAAAVNSGVKESKGEFIALVNNDVELSPEWFDRVVAALSKDAKIAAATGKVLFRDRPKTVNDLGDTLLLNGAGLHRGLGMPDEARAEIAYVGAPSGAACLIRKSDFLAVGGFDDSYFAYFEDIDLGWRFWLSGHKVVCVSSAVAYHRWRWTAKRFGNEFKCYHDAKNSFATFVKNAERRYLPEAFLLWILRVLFDGVRRTKAGDGRAIIGIVRSLSWCSRNLRPLLSKRSRIQHRRIISDSYLIELGVLGRLREALGEVMRIRKLAWLL
jgi:GT2 family glycosyltransferase